MVTSKSRSVPARNMAGGLATDAPNAMRRKLLEVALVQFGQAGFKGASTRAIAAEAGTNMSSITYHFGSKHGLYLATARHVSGLLQTWIVSAIDSAARACRGLRDPIAARRALHGVFERAAEVFNAEETKAVSRFIVMEQAEAGEGFALIYGAAMGPMIDGVVALLLAALDHCIAEEEARIRSVVLFGQVLVFSVSRGSVLRTNRWSEVGPDQLAMIKRVIATNLDAVLDRLLEENAG